MVKVINNFTRFYLKKKNGDGGERDLCVCSQTWFLHSHSLDNPWILQNFHWISVKFPLPHQVFGIVLVLGQNSIPAGTKTGMRLTFLIAFTRSWCSVEFSAVCRSCYQIFPSLGTGRPSKYTKSCVPKTWKCIPKQLRSQQSAHLFPNSEHLMRRQKPRQMDEQAESLPLKKWGFNSICSRHPEGSCHTNKNNHHLSASNLCSRNSWRAEILSSGKSSCSQRREQSPGLWAHAQRCPGTGESPSPGASRSQLEGSCRNWVFTEGSLVGAQFPSQQVLPQTVFSNEPMPKN